MMTRALGLNSFGPQLLHPSNGQPREYLQLPTRKLAVGDESAAFYKAPDDPVLTI